MESISYGAVPLDVVKTNSVVKTHTREESQNAFLFTKWEIDVICTINPGAMSLSAVVGPGGFLTPTPGTMPGPTWNNIAAILRTPRQRLIIRAGGAVILDVPQIAFGQAARRYTCDAKMGPFCEVVAVNQIIGVTNFIAHLKFTAHVNDCVSSNDILANSWTIEETIDEQQYPTRTVEGLAILRADVMREYTFNADEYRHQFFFPVPLNFQREQVNVKMNEDGTQLRYTMTDVGKCKNVGLGSVFSKVNIYHSADVSVGSPFRALGNANQELLQAATNAFPNPLAMANAAFQLPGMLLRHTRENLPKFNHTVTFEGWGIRTADDGFMFRTGLGVCFSVMGQQTGTAFQSLGALFLGMSEYKVNQCLHDKYVSVSMSISWGTDTAIGLSAPGLAADLAAQAALIRSFNNNWPTVNANANAVALFGNVQSPILDQSPGGIQDNPAFGSNGSRSGVGGFTRLPTGGYPGNPRTRFVTQLLMAPCDPPPQPLLRYPPNVQANQMVGS